MFLSDIAETLQSAAVALEQEDFAQAMTFSRKICDALGDLLVPPVLDSDDQDRPYSIIVVAYQTAAEHAKLVDVLLDLDQSRFELIFVENASECLFDIPASRTGSNVKVLRLDANMGIGVARNIAIRAASGQGILLIDDDGITDADSLEALIEQYTATAATAVRGRVIPHSDKNGAPPQHYAPGTREFQRYIDIEGLSIWRRADLMRAGLFDPILFGHEGVELTARLYPLCGPDAFIYEPRAVLYHDFSSEPAGRDKKLKRYEKLTKYIQFKIPNYNKILNVFRKAPQDLVAAALLQHRRQFVAAAPVQQTPVSIITTCYNGADHLEDFVDGLAHQSDLDFELVFVDDGSHDNSVELMRRIVPDTIRMQLIEGPQTGRSAALNTAIAAAKHDICLIADADDVSLPHRVAWTKKAYAAFPDAAMIGFMIYDTDSHARATRPFPHEPIPLSVRNVFGMPAPFPGFSFRKSCMPEPFDPSLSAGVDCDCLFRNMRNRNIDGYLIPLNVTYYRTHSGQITASRRHIQQAISIRHLTHRHETMLNSRTSDETALSLFAGWTPVSSGPDYWKMHEYGLQLIAKISSTQNSNKAVLSQEIMAHLAATHKRVLQTDYSRLKKHHESALNSMSQMRSELDYTRHSLDAMQKSTSWRVTSPFRRIARWAGRS